MIDYLKSLTFRYAIEHGDADPTEDVSVQMRDGEAVGFITKRGYLEPPIVRDGDEAGMRAYLAAAMAKPCDHGDRRPSCCCQAIRLLQKGAELVDGDLVGEGCGVAKCPVCKWDVPPLEPGTTVVG